MPRATPPSSTRRGARAVVAALAVLLAGGCALQLRNLEPAREVAQASAPPTGSVYAGWRVFQNRCASCHGADASGVAGQRDLLPALRDMTPRRFVAVVLNRYDLGLVASESRGDARVDAVVRRTDGLLTMPAWDGEPVVTAHVMDLYAYLAARADGTQGRGRPAP